MSCPKQSHNKNLEPIFPLNVESIIRVQCTRPLICLADSGSTTSLVNKSSMPYALNQIKTVTTKTTTNQCTYTSYEFMFLNNIVLPEFFMDDMFKEYQPICSTFPVVLTMLFLDKIFYKRLDSNWISKTTVSNGWTL